MTVGNTIAGQNGAIREEGAEKLTSNGPFDLLPRNRSTSDSLLQVVLQLFLELVAVANGLSKLLDGVEILEEMEKEGEVSSVRFKSRLDEERKRRV